MTYNRKSLKMRYLLFFCILLCACNPKSETSVFEQQTRFEQSNGLETATYEETISYYESLATHFPEITIKAIGETDSGKPLHLVTLNPNGTEPNFEKLRETNRIILINNGIHPGESDGIDATMLLFRDFANRKLKLPKRTIIATIPIYNVGGSLNRNTTSRTNQNGPNEYGFRGNARNYDLNRDFIKADTKNAKTFATIFHFVKPDVFIDTHVSNGADYQYTLTHLFTQHNKLGGPLGRFLHDSLVPQLELNLQKKEWDITPYVNVFNRTPDSGFVQFNDTPRYSTGYTTLFNTLGMMVETHMLKPYKNRVEGTYELIHSLVELTDKHGETISLLRKEQQNIWSADDHYPIAWKIDTTKHTDLNFKGYEGEYIDSDLTNGKRLKYNRNKPFVKTVKYQNYYKASDSVRIPKAYVIPQGIHHIIDRLKNNAIAINTLSKDSILNVESYKIDSYKTRQNPYEGHYRHYNTRVKSKKENVKFKAGDFIVHTNQAGIRYLLETLEPHAPDSFFNWNYFDTILQQKEGFSPYVWEDKAKLLLASNPRLQIKFNLKKSLDKDFANNWYAQLDWLHKNSPHYEKAHLQYPIYRLH